MKRFALYTTVCAFMLCGGLVLTAAGQALEDPSSFITDIPKEKRGQTGLKFLSVSVTPQAAALQNTVTAAEANSSSMFYNPAGMGWMDQSVDVALGQTQWIGKADYNYFSAAYRPLQGEYGIVGLSVVSVSYGEIQETVRAANEQGYRKMGTISPSAISIGLGYAQAVTDRFSVGGNAKYVQQSLGSHPFGTRSGGGVSRQSYAASTVALDFGMFYRTGFRSLTFAASVRNLARELTYEEENFELPLTFEIGLSADLFSTFNMPSDVHDLRVSVDGRRPRDYFEQVQVGLEYTFMDLFSLRGGYVVPHDEKSYALGGALQHEFGELEFGASYSYTPFGRLSNVNRIGARIGF